MVYFKKEHKKMKNKAMPVIVHVDMDAFYASIEQIDRIEYRNRPLVVGADPRAGKGRGVVSAASYEARKYGIHAAMPISRAYRLCPSAVFVRPRMVRYLEVSRHIMKILHEFSPVIEQISIDEAFLDCSGTLNLIGPSHVLAQRIKDRIQKETSLTASVGVATNKSIAKIASELGKPDGLMICRPGDEKKFLEDLSLDYLWGAGKKTVEKLRGLGYKKIGDIAACPSERLIKEFGKRGLHLWYLANGIDERPVIIDVARKSISEEITFSSDVESDRHIEHTLFRISDRLSRKMRNLNLKGRTITVKIRLQDFETFTRNRTFSYPVNDMNTIRSACTYLYRNFARSNKKVRLIGIAVSNLEKKQAQNTEQLELFQEDKSDVNSVKQEPQKKADELIDEMKRLYGSKVTRAVFLPNFFDRERE